MSQSKRNKRRILSLLRFLDVSKGKMLGRLVAFFSFFLLLLLVHNLFLIRKIECRLDSDPCPTEVESKFNKYLDTSMLLLNQKLLAKSVKESSPIEEIKFGFKVMNTLTVSIKGGNPPIIANVYFVQELPKISMDTNPGSSESAGWIKPVTEISLQIKSASASSFSLWDTGLIIPEEKSQSNVHYIFTEKPSSESIKSIYKLIKISNKFLNVSSIHILGTRIFLSQEGQPDIIVSVPFDERQVLEALQSYNYLAGIKKDAKVIDLRFKNPIIR